MKKIKVLTVSTSGFAKKEGISTVILDNYKCFRKDRFDLRIAVSGDYGYSLITEFENADIRIHCLPSRKNALIQYIKALIRLFRKEKFDVLYIHGSSAIMSIELLVAALLGCKIRVVHSHNTTCEHKTIDKLLRPLFYLLYTDAFACGNEAGKWLYGNRSFQVITNGRDIEKYKFDPYTRKEIRDKYEIDNDTLVIGHVGNFNKQKNQQFVLKVFQQIKRIKPNSKLFLMGEGTLYNEIVAQSEEMKLQDQVVFTGSINNVHEMIQAMDIMVLPSLHEGLPLVVVEWQIAALPCVLSDVITKECAYSELVSFMSLSDSPEKWAEKVIEVAKISRQSYATKAQELTRKSGFDLKENAYKLQQYFENRINGEQRICLHMKD